MGRVHDTLMQIDGKYRHYHDVKNEKNKINDPRRQKILSQVILSSEQKSEVDDLFLRAYGKKVPYDWHRYYTSYTGKFDPKYIPELIFIPEIEAALVPRNYAECFSDKNILPMLVTSGGV